MDDNCHFLLIYTETKPERKKKRKTEPFPPRSVCMEGTR